MHVNQLSSSSSPAASSNSSSQKAAKSHSKAQAASKSKSNSNSKPKQTAAAPKRQKQQQNKQQAKPKASKSGNTSNSSKVGTVGKASAKHSKPPVESKEAPATSAKPKAKAKAKAKVKAKATPKRSTKSSAAIDSEPELAQSAPPAADALRPEPDSLLVDVQTAADDVASAAAEVEGERKADSEQSQQAQSAAAAAAEPESEVRLLPGLSVLPARTRALQLRESAASEEDYLAQMDATIDFSLAGAAASVSVHDIALDKQHSKQRQQSEPKAVKKPKKQAEKERQQRSDTFHAFLNLWTLAKPNGADDSEATATIQKLRSRYEAFVSETPAAADMQHLKNISSQWISKIFTELVSSSNCSLDSCTFHTALRKSKAASAEDNADAILRYFEMSNTPALPPSGSKKTKQVLKAHQLRHDSHDEALKFLSMFFPSVCAQECQREHVIAHCNLLHITNTQDAEEQSASKKLSTLFCLSLYDQWKMAL